MLETASLLVTWAACETGEDQDTMWGLIPALLGGDVHRADREVWLICYYLADLLIADLRNPGGDVLLNLATRLIAYVAACQTTTTEEEN